MIKIFYYPSLFSGNIFIKRKKHERKEKVLTVILGVSIVELIIALAAAFIDGLTLLVDAAIYKGCHILMGAMEMGAAVLGLIFVAVFFLNRKKTQFGKFNFNIAHRCLFHC